MLFLFFAKITKTNLTYVGYYQKGILVFGDERKTGEYYFVKEILKKIIKKKDQIFIDVGSNKNDYSKMLVNFFERSKVYSFEANPHIFLDKKKIKNVIDYNLALGSEKKNTFIYDYKNKPKSSHSSLYKNVLKEIHKSNDIEKITTEMTTLDFFCKVNQIQFIDFIKIDTEGNELDVIKGAKEMLSKNKIHVIQFEFNEMNVISRVFLKDFYNHLKNYNFYRLKNKKIIALGEYKTENEIFKFQNIIAINKVI